MNTKTITLTVDELDRLVSHLGAIRDSNDIAAQQVQRTLDQYVDMDAGALLVQERRRDRHLMAVKSASGLIAKIGHVRTDLDEPAWLRATA